MQQTLMMLPIVLAVLFWAGYHYHKDRALPEPPGNLVLCFLLGIAGVGVSQLLYAGLEPLGLRFDAGALALESKLALMAYAVLAIGPIEELAKLLPFLLVAWRFKAFDEPIDGIIYASFIALGYAAAENLQYLEYQLPLEAAARAFASPVVHILFASIWAYPASMAKMAHRSAVLPFIGGFLVAAVLHGLYDYLVLLQPLPALPRAALLIVVLWFWRLHLLRKMHDAQAAQNSSS